MSWRDRSNEHAKLKPYHPPNVKTVNSRMGLPVNKNLLIAGMLIANLILLGYLLLNINRLNQLVPNVIGINNQQSTTIDSNRNNYESSNQQLSQELSNMRNNYNVLANQNIDQVRFLESKISQLEQRILQLELTQNNFNTP